MARTTHATRSSTWFRITKTESYSDPLGLVYLKNHNMRSARAALGLSTPPDGQYRIRTMYTGNYTVDIAALALRAKPLAILASSNLTGAVASLQDVDPEQPAGTYLTASSATTNTDLRVSFEATTGSLAAGTGLQQFRVLCRRTGGGGTNPTLTVELWYSGSLVSTLSSGGAVSSTTGSLQSFTWNASALPGDRLAANVQLRVRGIASATATVEFDCLEFNQEVTSGSGYTYYDSGTLLVENGLDSLNHNRQQLEILHLLPAPVDWDVIWIDLIHVTNDAGYIEIGAVCASDGLAVQLPSGEDGTPAYGVQYLLGDTSRKMRNDHGSTYSELGTIYKILELEFPSVDEESAFTSLLQRVFRSHGTTGSFLFVLEDYCIWGSFADPGGVARNAWNSWTTSRMRIEETL